MSAASAFLISSKLIAGMAQIAQAFYEQRCRIYDDGLFGELVSKTYAGKAGISGLVCWY
jgi:hypothetical protein